MWKGRDYDPFREMELEIWVHLENRFDGRSPNIQLYTLLQDVK